MIIAAMLLRPTTRVLHSAIVGRIEPTLVETGITSSALRERGVARTCLCRVVAGGNRGQEVWLGARGVLVGADAECDLVLADPKVSRRHAELRLTATGVRVRDLESRNGTFHGNARVHDGILPIGSTLTVGDTQIGLVAPNEPRIEPSTASSFGSLVGESLPMRELFAILALAARSSATVLLQGESGTGKELAARALHAHSERAQGPFVVVDCGAANESLIESQLFGHTRGAFTGAVASREGAFVAARGGTLFLDEIGELTAGSQAKLLRALEARTVQPVGSDAPVAVDVRVVAATHRDLPSMVREGSFRFDLFHRLAVVHVVIPPLRERHDDLPALVHDFYASRGCDPGPLGGANLQTLAGHGWPGNVRELRNVLERAWVLSGEACPPFAGLNLWLGGTFAPRADIAIDTQLPFKEAKDRWVEIFERRYLAEVFTRFAGNITHAAAHAQIQRRHFRELLRRYGLVP